MMAGNGGLPWSCNGLIDFFCQIAEEEAGAWQQKIKCAQKLFFFLSKRHSMCLSYNTDYNHGRWRSQKWRVKRIVESNEEISMLPPIYKSHGTYSMFTQAIVDSNKNKYLGIGSKFFQMYKLAKFINVLKKVFWN